MKFKKWNKKEIEGFCEDNFMEQEDIDAIYVFVERFPLVALDMEYGKKDETGNQKGILVIKINESE